MLTFGRITRRDFLRLAALLGLCGGTAWAKKGPDSGKVLVVGAGAAGLSAAYLLNQQGVAVEVLEAQGCYGGRFKVNRDFAEFPIPLGAEWLHVKPSELDKILNTKRVKPDIELRPYDRGDVLGLYQDGEYLESVLGDSGDSKFIGSSWFDFFQTYVVPSIQSKIKYHIEIKEVDYTDSKVVLTDKNKERFVADKVILTVPLRLLQLGSINFHPPLTPEKRKAIRSANVWSGLKMFIEFSQKFYPTVLAFSNSETPEGQRYLYDAAVGQNASRPILGVFSVGAQAEAYIALNEEHRIKVVLEELDRIFDGAASRTYLRHLTQDWNVEPFARGAYLSDVSPSWIPRDLSRSVDGKLYFAGEAYTEGEDWGGVHDAARSARSAVRELLWG